MSNQNHELLDSLRERDRELTCISDLESILARQTITIRGACRELVDLVERVWPQPFDRHTRITLACETFRSRSFRESPNPHKAGISVKNHCFGSIEFHEPLRAIAGEKSNEGAEMLAYTLARRFSQFLLFKQAQQIFHEWQTATSNQPLQSTDRGKIGLFRKIDNDMFISAAKKMLDFVFLGTNINGILYCPLLRFSRPQHLEFGDIACEPTGGTVWCAFHADQEPEEVPMHRIPVRTYLMIANSSPGMRCPFSVLFDGQSNK